MKSKLLSVVGWMTWAFSKPKRTEPCKYCQLPLERSRSASAPTVTRDIYCQVCRAMITAASTPYLFSVQARYEEEQKRKMILMFGGNYLG